MVVKTQELGKERFVSGWKFEACKSVFGRAKARFERTPHPCKYVNALDKGVTEETYGKATNKGLTNELKAESSKLKG
jgi:hypothetical protein